MTHENPADSHDAETLAFYDREAEVYAARARDGRHPALDQFIARMPPGAAVLELGCGGGQDAEALLAAGLNVTPTDGSPGMAKQAEARLGQPVRVMRFVELRDERRYDGV